MMSESEFQTRLGSARPCNRLSRDSRVYPTFNNYSGFQTFPSRYKQLVIYFCSPVFTSAIFPYLLEIAYVTGFTSLNAPKHAIHQKQIKVQIPDKVILFFLSLSLSFFCSRHDYFSREFIRDELR